MCIDNFISYIVTQKRYSKHTVLAYKKDLHQLNTFLEETYQFNLLKPSYLRKIKLNHLRSWLAYLSGQSVTAKSIARKLSSLKSYFAYLKKQGVIEFNTTAKLSAPKTAKRLPVFVNDKQMAMLFERVHFTSDFAGLRDKLILELLYLTGMRRAELTALKIEDINFNTGNIRITGKGNKQRLIPAHPNLLEFISNYLVVLNQTFPKIKTPDLLRTDKGVKLYPKFVYNTVKKYLSLFTTLKKKSPHILRHTFATHMMNNGADLNTVKTLLGHSSLASTQIYTHNSIKELQEIYKKAHPKS